MPRDTLDPVYFGKLPTRGDFVRHNAARPSVRALDEWIQHGLHAAKRRPDFEEAYDAAAPCFFLFNPREVPGALVGVMHPSRDRTGRRYPFIVALDAGGRSMRPQRMAHLPVHLRAFFEEARKLARRAVEEEADPGDPAAHLPPTHLPETPARGALRGYKRYLQQMQVGLFWDALWDGRAADAKTQLVGNLIEVLGPLHRGVPARFKLGMQFPLPVPAKAWSFERDAYVASFWCETCLRLLGFPDVAPTCFWTATPAGAPGDRSTLLFLRPPPAGAYAHLVSSGYENDNVYVLDRHGAAQAREAARQPPPPFEALLQDGQVRLWDLLRQLH